MQVSIVVLTAFEEVLQAAGAGYGKAEGIARAFTAYFTAELTSVETSKICIIIPYFLTLLSHEVSKGRQANLSAMKGDHPSALLVEAEAANFAIFCALPLVPFINCLHAFSGSKLLFQVGPNPEA